MKAIFPGMMAAALLLATPGAAQDTPPLQHDVVFAETTPLSGNSELARRALTPLTAARLQRTLAQSGEGLREQAVTPAEEKFLLYVPRTAPPGGYGVLVFIPPWQSAAIPPGWAPVLESDGIIFVSAVASGNDANVLSRRMPLALIAAHNIMRRYHVDPARVFVSGLSGGSRVAMRLALAYPDLFVGALLNAGSDPVGDRITPLPPRALWNRFQEESRLVYLTGQHDDGNLRLDGASMRSMRAHCMFNIDAITMAHLGHETADAVSLARGLDKLLRPARSDAGQLAACRTETEKDLAFQLDRVAALIQAGSRAEARTLLEEIDGRFGGLAAPRSLELDTAIDQGP